MKMKNTILSVLVQITLAITISAADRTDKITTNGIEWVFDKEYTVGQFANGDYWVIGPVVVREITPSYTGKFHGWEVNPLYKGGQGFDGRVDDFDASLVPDLPYTARPGESLVKAVSYRLSEREPRPSIRAAAVLTVLSEAPPNDGADVFRPAYVGSDKKLYRVADLRTDLLPAYPEAGNAPSLDWVHDRFRLVQLDHRPGKAGRYLHPADHLPNYGADIGKDNADAVLRLMLDDPIDEKMPGLIAYVQYGIDLYHMMKIGHTWPEGGGHRPGQKIVITFAAVMLDEEEMKTGVLDAEFFHEDKGVIHESNAGDVALFGFSNKADEEKYWQTLVSGLDGTPSGYKAYPDPYGYIDGGPEPGTNYQYCCTSQPWKGSALACHLMPELKSLWIHDRFFEYVDRYVNEGLWTQPDPCAPADDDWSNYGVTFGPDGKGGCIKDTDPSDGVGRFPELHGTGADEGQRSSSFQGAMWDVYRDAERHYTSTTTSRPLKNSGAGGASFTVGAVKGGFQLEYASIGSNPIEVRVFDPAGRRLFQKEYMPSSRKGVLTIPTNSFADAARVHCVEIRCGGKKTTRKLTLLNRP